MHTLQTVNVRPEVDRMAAYLPGESLEGFSLRTGIPVDQLIKLNSNESPFGPAPQVLEALSNHANYNYYPDTDSTALRHALAAYTRIDSRYIVVSHGSNELINLLWHIFLSVGDTIICCPPTFSLYTSITTFCGASVLEVPRLPDYEVDVEGILAALTPETKMIILCSPNNPTGNLIPERDVLALLDTGRIIVVDEAYVEFSHQGNCFSMRRQGRIRCYLYPYERIITSRYTIYLALSGPAPPLATYLSVKEQLLNDSIVLMLQILAKASYKKFLTEIRPAAYSLRSTLL